MHHGSLYLPPAGIWLGLLRFDASPRTFKRDHITDASSFGKSLLFDKDFCVFQQAEFSSISLALAQTFVMTVGELNYQSTFLEAFENGRMAFPGTTYLVFVLFVLLMPILLMNLMVGLVPWNPAIIVNDSCNSFGSIRLICLNHVADRSGGGRHCGGTEKRRIKKDSHAGEHVTLL